MRHSCYYTTSHRALHPIPSTYFHPPTRLNHLSRGAPPTPNTGTNPRTPKRNTARRRTNWTNLSRRWRGSERARGSIFLYTCSMWSSACRPPASIHPSRPIHPHSVPPPASAPFWTRLRPHLLRGHSPSLLPTGALCYPFPSPFSLLATFLPHNVPRPLPFRNVHGVYFQHSVRVTFFLLEFIPQCVAPCRPYSLTRLASRCRGGLLII
ncbi:hypothetical protein C8J57DRAFT_716056 [Mycena rebaudengoi]|nr:hypothetical protein C8J57DRAFT_62426 [Mycena rebaudengoi]KAJ7248785.1 hypothetical protein C8J57DRAFT_716056 [Mycena rebaudengoi]